MSDTLETLYSKPSNIFTTESSNISKNTTRVWIWKIYTLEEITVLGLLPHDVRHGINELNPLCVMSLGPIVSSPILAKIEFVGPEDLAIRASPHAIHGTRLRWYPVNERKFPKCRDILILVPSSLYGFYGVQYRSSNPTPNLILWFIYASRVAGSRNVYNIGFPPFFNLGYRTLCYARNPKSFIVFSLFFTIFGSGTL